MLKYYDELVSYVQKMTKDKEQALEIVQETYARTLEKQKEIKIENERAFLYKVARNLTFDYSKKVKNKEFIEYKEENHFCSIEEQPDEIVLENIKEELLIEALETLPKHLKQVFVLHIFDGYDKKQIAKILNLSLNTVQKYVIAATTKLTEYIEEKEWN
ncbi:RNA polymerase sigma factor [Arcobacter lacus]|uniref:RNA polymerase sigma factor n=1 Tax=Arcobacter lacus TaxID=1912876 RepID=A0ABX5JEJ0_9BACT|nr:MULTISPECIES: RNA polymerase sigma factor [Arcobacteraceae]MCT7650229.1 RNA polymerase sigma factor [Aliarcobacter butzleri]MCT7911244.1 RNA polymerase sigma factor [Arcobacter lacus]PUE64639.1 RNA polymerase subunit sigma [Arcobacter lacus]